jgi:hypothetical protein
VKLINVNDIRVAQQHTAEYVNAVLVQATVWWPVERQVTHVFDQVMRVK